MFPFFNFQYSYSLRKLKFFKILNLAIEILDYFQDKLYFPVRKTAASSDNNPKRKPAVLNVDSVTIFWIVAAFLFIPLILTGLLSH
ncbi:MAG: hypothetical protein AB4372_19385 [Xenococcus sp. (in: cyanobacteria)]